MALSFSHLRYTFTPYKATHSRPILYDFKDWHLMAREAQFLTFHKAESKITPLVTMTHGTVYDRNQSEFREHHGKAPPPPLSKAELILKELGIVSHSEKGHGWLMPDEFRHTLRTTFELPSDRYAGLGMGVYNQGSSRHAFISALQIKGCGRNRLSIREDFQHSSGFMTLEQAVWEYVYCHHVTPLLPLGAGKIKVVSSYQEKNGRPRQMEGLYLAFSARNAPSIRQAQITPGLWFTGEKTEIRKQLREVYKSLDAKVVLRQLALQQASSFLFGVFQGSVIPDNYTLSTELIDLGTVRKLEGWMTTGFLIEKKSKDQADPFKFGFQPRKITTNNMTSLLDYSLLESGILLNEFITGKLTRAQLRAAFLDAVLDLQKEFGMEKPLRREQLKGLFKLGELGSMGSTSKTFLKRHNGPTVSSQEIIKALKGKPGKVSCQAVQETPSTFWAIRINQACRMSKKSIIGAFNERKVQNVNQLFSRVWTLAKGRIEQNLDFYESASLANSIINDNCLINPFSINKSGKLMKRVLSPSSLWKIIISEYGNGMKIEAIEFKIFTRKGAVGDFKMESLSLSSIGYEEFKKKIAGHSEFILFNLAVKGKQSPWYVPVVRPELVSTTLA